MKVKEQNPAGPLGGVDLRADLLLNKIIRGIKLDSKGSTPTTFLVDKAAVNGKEKNFSGIDLDHLALCLSVYYD